MATNLGYLRRNWIYTRNAINTTPTTEPTTPITDINIGGAYGCKLKQCSIIYDTNAQATASFKVVIDGIAIEPNQFQQFSDAAIGFNLVFEGDEIEVPQNAHLRVYAYNSGSGSVTSYYDIIVSAKQYTAESSPVQVF